MTELRRLVPSLNALAVFEAAGRLGGFSRAGRELRISQPAVTRHVRGLEEAVGQPLFVRSNNRVALTEAGLRLWHAVNTGFGDIAAVVEALRRAEIARPLTFATHAGFGQMWLMPRLEALRTHLDGRTISLSIVDAATELDRSGFDVAVRHGAGQWPGQRAARLFDETVMPVASRGYVEARPHLETAAPADLLAERLIHMDEGDRPWMTWSQWFRLAGVARTPPPAGVRLNHYPLVMSEVMAGAGIGLGWRPLVDPLLESGVLVAVGPDMVREGYGWWLAWPEGAVDGDLDRTLAWFRRETGLAGAQATGAAPGPGRSGSSP